MIKNDKLIIVRGGGDLATGTIHRLWSAGFDVIVLEVERPAAIRRQVSVCEAVYGGETVVEGMRAKLVGSIDEAEAVLSENAIPVLIDPEGKCISLLNPKVVVDAIIAKKNLGTTIDMAPVTIALGPGFEAGVDVNYVVETKRGHDLGRIIRSGFAVKNSGIPGNIGGYAIERVIKSPAEGEFIALKSIADIVEAGDKIAEIVSKDGSRTDVITVIPGILRGVLKSGYTVTEGFKVADVDPRKEELKNCFTISDKARCIAGGVLELCVSAVYGEKRIDNKLNIKYN